MKKIRIIIGRDGKTTMRVEGVAGPGCLELTEAFEKAVGEVEERTLCDAYNQEVNEEISEDLEETI